MVGLNQRQLQVVRLALKELYFSDMETDRAIKYLESLSDGVERPEEIIARSPKDLERMTIWVVCCRGIQLDW